MVPLTPSHFLLKASDWFPVKHYPFALFFSHHLVLIKLGVSRCCLLAPSFRGSTPLFCSELSCLPKTAGSVGKGIILLVYLLQLVHSARVSTKEWEEARNQGNQRELWHLCQRQSAAVQTAASGCNLRYIQIMTDFHKAVPCLLNCAHVPISVPHRMGGSQQACLFCGSENTVIGTTQQVSGKQNGMKEWGC